MTVKLNAQEVKLLQSLLHGVITYEDTHRPELQELLAKLG